MVMITKVIRIASLPTLRRIEPAQKNDSAHEKRKMATDVIAKIIEATIEYVDSIV